MSEQKRHRGNYQRERCEVWSHQNGDPNDDPRANRWRHASRCGDEDGQRGSQSAAASTSFIGCTTWNSTIGLAAVSNAAVTPATPPASCAASTNADITSAAPEIGNEPEDRVGAEDRG